MVRCSLIVDMNAHDYDILQNKFDSLIWPSWGQVCGHFTTII